MNIYSYIECKASQYFRRNKAHCSC